MKKLLLISAIIAAGLLSLSPEALAQAATTALDDQVTIPWGEWVGNIAVFIAASAALIVAILFRQLPAEWVAMAKTARLDQLLEKAIQYGANTVEGATMNKTLSVPVANDLIEGALEYAVNHGPGTVINWVGGKEALRQKIIARLDVEEKGAVTG